MSRIGRIVLFLGGLLLSAAAPGKVVTETVDYRHQDTPLQGYLAYDDAVKGPRPGVLVIHEWWGLNDYIRERARQLAEQGYVALAVDMYGQGKSTEHPEQAQQWSQAVRERRGLMALRARAGLELLREQSRVDPQRVGAIGFCFGGTSVLELAYSGADLDGVVSFHGGLTVPDEQARARIASPIVILHGAADPLVKQETLNQFKQALNAAEADWQMVIYGGARHGFTNPAADRHGMEALGYDPVAAQRSWEHMLRFFEEQFAARPRQ